MAYVNPADTGQSFSQVEPPVPPIEQLNILPSANGSVLDNGTLQSPNYVRGNSGWRIDSDGSAEFRNIDTSSSKLLKSFVSGEYINTGDAVFSGQSRTITLLSSSNDHAVDVNFGNADASMREAQSITETSDIYINAIKIYLKKAGSPTDTLYCAIQRDDVATGTHPSGTDLAYGTISGSSLTGAYVQTTFTLNTAIKLVANTRYWIVLRRSPETIDGANFYRVAVNTGSSSTYANGNMWEWGQSGDSWASKTPDFDFQLCLVTTTGRIYKTSAANSGEYESFIGFSDATGIPGEDTLVNIAGISTQSGLSVGSQYYIANARGSISSTAGSNTRKAGIAVSTTELLITNLW